MSREHVVFTVEGPEAEATFIRKYVLEAVERLPEQQICEAVNFVRHSTSVTSEEAAVAVTFIGDGDAIAEHERNRWDDFIEEDIINDWEREEHPWDHIDIPERTEAFNQRMHTLAARLSVTVFEEFESPPAPVEEFQQEEGASPSGWWTLLHLLTNHQGYSQEEEIAASMQNVRNQLFYMAEQQDHAVASEKIDELVETLETWREETRTPRWEIE